MLLHLSGLAQDLSKIRRFLSRGAEQGMTLDQRQFAYIASVSAIYSTFENFAERTAHTFSQVLMSDPSQLSEDQRDRFHRKYVQNSAALLNQSLGTGRYRDVTEYDVAKSLTSCLDNSTPYDIRLEIVSLHQSNLRWKILPDLYQWATSDIPNLIRKSDAVQTWMPAETTDSTGALLSTLESELDDLVERRNEVAHRAIPDEILSPENLIAKADFIEAISLGLVASLSGILIDKAISHGRCVFLGEPTARYMRNRVIIMAPSGVELKVGDCVATVSEGSTRWGRILGIQLDDKPAEVAPPHQEAGLKLGFACRSSAKVYLWPEPESDLSDPPSEIFGRWGPLDSSQSAT